MQERHRGRWDKVSVPGWSMLIYAVHFWCSKSHKSDFHPLQDSAYWPAGSISQKPHQRLPQVFLKNFPPMRQCPTTPFLGITISIYLAPSLQRSVHCHPICTLEAPNPRSCGFLPNGWNVERGNEDAHSHWFVLMWSQCTSVIIHNRCHQVFACNGVFWGAIYHTFSPIEPFENTPTKPL